MLGTKLIMHRQQKTADQEGLEAKANSTTETTEKDPNQDSVDLTMETVGETIEMEDHSVETDVARDTEVLEIKAIKATQEDLTKATREDLTKATQEDLTKATLEDLTEETVDPKRVEDDQAADTSAMEQRRLHQKR